MELNFFDMSSERFMSEKKIRKIAYKKNVEELQFNEEDFFVGDKWLSITFKNLNNAIKGNIRDVIDDLNQYWGYDIRIIEKDFFNYIWRLNNDKKK